MTTSRILVSAAWISCVTSMSLRYRSRRLLRLAAAALDDAGSAALDLRRVDAEVADARVRVAERGALGRDQEVATQRELEAAGHGRAVDRADDRLRHRPEHRERAAMLVVAPTDEVRRRAAELAEVETGAERRVGAGKD